jgi:hypothetical protein
LLPLLGAFFLPHLAPLRRGFFRGPLACRLPFSVVVTVRQPRDPQGNNIGSIRTPDDREDQRPRSLCPVMSFGGYLGKDGCRTIPSVGNVRVNDFGLVVRVNQMVSVRLITFVSGHVGRPSGSDARRVPVAVLRAHPRKAVDWSHKGTNFLFGCCEVSTSRGVSLCNPRCTNVLSSLLVTRQA